MSRLIAALLPLAVLPSPALAAGIDETINNLTAPLATLIGQIVFFKVTLFGAGLPLVVLWLVAGAVFFTFYMGFVNLRGFKHAIELVRGDYADPDSAGEVSHFQALATAVSGTVGIGNIGGVAVAVTVGGPGATFWLILAGFLGMSTKFVECTLGVKYRNENPDGSVSGGPMYYLSKGFAERGMEGFGKVIGTFYAIGIFVGALGIGNMFQSNQAYVQLNTVAGGRLDGYGWLIGLILAAVVFAVIIGGIKSIARVTEKIVPFMAVFYCVFAIIVILMNFTAIPEAIANVFTGAFTGEGVAGGALGALIIGFQRAVFSNEAGIGSASIAHSAVKTDEPVTEGYVSLLEPFIDTIVICTITAMVIGTSQVADPGFAGEATGVAMTSAAFERQLSWFPLPLAFAALLFAFSTMISWSYYGLKGWTYLFGEGDAGQTVYKLIFCAFVALGCVVQLGPILDISDALVFLICVPNILGLYFLAPIVRREMDDYRARLARGEIRKYA
ncbi:alanine:cation symporter family protein [Defluviimonas sp. WL0024]|uniref:Alanine:cation symporter family protein n=2 Tax=Albidovulum TaxID=205889 RepID=A0ABT3J8M2_9RHOB|nr:MULTISPECIES: alanine/glycine:cation symporter family protein [Defluviimonas]MCU9849793.1 alanine:cation symporter family protein [Defluviimonas sp. WL0024]MCW3784038.1 alanine:cation symporter family protein [Defluviimonas salinarum]